MGCVGHVCELIGIDAVNRRWSFWVVVSARRTIIYRMEHLMAAPFIATCILICTIFSLIILKLRPRRDLYEKVSKFPGPPTLPLIGNAHLFTGSTEAILDKFAQLSKSYPAPYRVWFGNVATIFINSPEHLKIVLNSPKTADKGPFYDIVGAYLGTGLATAPATKWRVHRKLIQPTFSLTILQSFIGIFSTRSATMAQEMEQHLNDGAEFDVYTYIAKCTLHTICETTMGVNLQTAGNAHYAETVDKVASGFSRRIVSPWLHPDFIFHLTKLGRDQKKNIKYLHDFSNNVIQLKKDQLLAENVQESPADKEESTGNGNSRRKILLDYLMELSHNSKTLSDEALREEVDTIILTGSDTTAVVNSYVMLMLASYPEVQENIYQELCEIYGVNDGEELYFTPAWADLTRMNYMERVIKETMRLFPILPHAVRMVTDDLDIGDHILPEGSQVILSIMDVHRDEKYWPDPLKFDPDRFLPEEVGKRHPYAYLAFSGGPSPGSKYAMVSMKILLATVLSKYILKKDTIIPVKDLRFKWELMLRPVDPITLRIERRTRNTSASI